MGVIFVLLLIVTKVHLARASDESSEENDSDITACQKETYDWMSSLSKYEVIRGDVHKDLFGGKICNPVNIWILHRHGTRYPSAGEIASIQSLLPDLKNAVVENHEAGRGTLSQDQVDRIADWTFDPSIESTPMYLTESGFNETKRTSGRFQQRFGSLFDGEYDARRFYSQHSETERTQRTSYAFIDGIFGEDAHQYVEEHVVPAAQDTLLYPFGGVCLKLTQLYINYTYIFAEITKFQQTNEYKEAVWLVNNRLGFENRLNANDIITIFGACAYDAAWNQETEPSGAWCPALGREGRLIGEYYWDLYFQAVSGYSGEEVVAKAGCGPVRDLWERFGTAVGELNVPGKMEDVAVLFTHDAQLLLTQRSLGLLQDRPRLSGTNYRKQGNRQWRTSELVPFASNIAAVLYKCTSPTGRVEHSVLLLRNERRMTRVPGCFKGVCSWDNFKRLVVPVAKGCNFKDFC